MLLSASIRSTVSELTVPLAFLALTLLLIVFSRPSSAASPDENTGRADAKHRLNESSGSTPPAHASRSNPPLSSVPLDFNSQVLPILSEHCFACHGPDAQTREADLRLDRFANATRILESGQAAISPGKPGSEHSELVHRITTNDPDLQMPPHERLNDEQIAVLWQWIASGADYQTHWSFEPVASPRLPKSPCSSGGPIDCFIRSHLDRQGLQPSPPANPRQLIRRVTLQLVGTLPDPRLVEELASSWSPTTYANYVDQLLSSPAYGEHMAAGWLDAARYADTNGYQHDNGRQMWPWRDWVIDAMNRNMPFDQFTIEQLAGDLLPNPTLENRVATGFNRNHGLNFEGGSIGAESRIDYVVDRTNTFGTVWLGLTLGCAQCHDHKYDPISQEDYYRLFAFFNNIDEVGHAGEHGNSSPMVAVPWPEQDRKTSDLKSQLDALESNIAEQLDQYDADQQRWEASIREGRVVPPKFPSDSLLLVDFESPAASGLPENRGSAATEINCDRSLSYCESPRGQAAEFDYRTRVDCGNVGEFETEQPFSFGGWVFAEEQQVRPIMGRAHFHGYNMVWDQGIIKINLVNRWDINAIFVQTKRPLAAGHWHHVFATYDGTSKGAGVAIYIDGQPQEIEVIKDDLTGSIKPGTNFFIGSMNHDTREMFRGRIDEVRVYDRRLSQVEIAQLAGQVELDVVLKSSHDARSVVERRHLREFFLQTEVPEFAELQQRQTELRREYYKAREERLTSMVMQERATPRETRILGAGRYDRPGKLVFAGAPGQLPPLTYSGESPTRLDLARWLVSGHHPLTARVAVNRFWQHFFGRGLVATPEDFGVQGARPSHPLLLDWLATEFVRSGWDVKHMHRLIVTSQTYQQDSTTSPELLQRDAENHWLSRFTRQRMPAFALRDSYLKSSQLIDLRFSGPGVMPPQPAGLWEELSFLSGHTAQEYAVSRGGDAYRRSIYTYWKRSCPAPNMRILDAAERSVCSVRTHATNTPLQALVLWNDPCFLDPAVAAAIHSIACEKIPAEGSVSNHNAAFRSVAETLDREPLHGRFLSSAISGLFHRFLSREPTPSELHALSRLYEESYVHYRSAPDKARQLVHGSFARPAESAQPGFVNSMVGDLSIAEVASMTSVAQVVMAMDEAISIN